MYFAGPLDKCKELLVDCQFITTIAFGILGSFIKTSNLKKYRSRSKYHLQILFSIFEKDPSTNEEIFFKKGKEFEGNPFVSAIIPDGNWKVYLFDKTPIVSILLL
jgi:hypothetical protein